jgi:hypothetical protein
MGLDKNEPLQCIGNSLLDLMADIGNFLAVLIGRLEAESIGVERLGDVPRRETRSPT